MSQNSAATLIAANSSALRAFETAIKIGFELAGSTVAAKIALSQVDLLIQEHDDIAAAVETIALPEPSEGVFANDALEGAMDEFMSTRLRTLTELAGDAGQRITAAAGEIGETIGQPESETVIGTGVLKQGLRFSYIQGVAEQAKVFATFIEGVPGALAARVMERLIDKLATSPAAPGTAQPVPGEIHLIEPIS